MAEPELPRVICDRCLKDVTLEYVGEYVVLSCHNEQHLMFRERLTGEATKVSVYVWTNIKDDFFQPQTLASRESWMLGAVLKDVEQLALFHRVRRAQGAEPTYVEDRARLDKLIDTLLLFRKDD